MAKRARLASWRPTLFYSIDRTYFGHKLRQSAADRNAFNSAGTGTLMPLEIARVSVRTSRGRVRSALSRYNAPRWANAFACQWRSPRSRKVPRLPTRRRSPPQVASGCSAIRRARSGPLPTPGCHYGGHRGPDVDRPVAPCRNPHLCQLRHEIRDGRQGPGRHCAPISHLGARFLHAYRCGHGKR